MLDPRDNVIGAEGLADTLGEWSLFHPEALQVRFARCGRNEFERRHLGDLFPKAEHPAAQAAGCSAAA